jgi:uncharacterized protein (TIGR02246 family)
MQTDEDQIQRLVSKWMAATKAGDVETVLDLMTDDVVFLIPGREPMGKTEFAAAAKAQSGGKAPKFDGHSEIQEIRVLGEWAFMWTKLAVTVTPSDGSPAMKRAGHTLTVLRKGSGKWRISRDANLLSPVQVTGT